MDNLTLIRVVAGLISIIVGGMLYFLPAVLGRKKRNHIAILMLNLFLGWTLVGWVVALVWALTNEPSPVQVVVQGAFTAGGQYCPGCGNLSVAGAAFCAGCGRSFLPQPSPASPPPAVLN